MMKYRKIVFYSTEKHKMQKNVGAFWNQLILYEIKLIFFVLIICSNKQHVN